MRIFNQLLLCGLFLVSYNCEAVSGNVMLGENQSITKQFTKLESSTDGELGIYAMNLANNHIIQYHANQRFPFCSTVKVMTVAAILKRSEQDPSLLNKRINYNQADVDKSGYAPITKQHIVDGMKISDLCQAALDYSDNGAMNLLLKILGGPKAVTQYARSIGDNSFRLDRDEPTLNTAIPGDERDTTTPIAMGQSLQRLLFTKVLAKEQQQLLQMWLKDNNTGNLRIRAGVPTGWVVGDKTGTGDYGVTNDIGVIWPPKKSPIVVIIYFRQKTKGAHPRDDVIAEVTKILLQELAS